MPVMRFVEQGAVTTVAIQCPRCKEFHELTVPSKGFKDYLEGTKVIQNCFPTLNADQREQFITGIDPTCWNKILGVES